MSAYIVSHSHIDALLTFAARHRVDYFVGDERVTITAFNATEIGCILLDENERSVRTRYPTDAADELPGTDDESTASYKWGPLEVPALHVLKGCDCFDYQACETDDYHSTVAHKIIAAIRATATMQLPGYDAAPWQINRPAVKLAELPLRTTNCRPTTK